MDELRTEEPVRILSEDHATLRYMLRNSEPLFNGCFAYSEMRVRYPDGFPDMERLRAAGYVERALRAGEPVGYVLTKLGIAEAERLGPYTTSGGHDIKEEAMREARDILHYYGHDSALLMGAIAAALVRRGRPR